MRKIVKDFISTKTDRVDEVIEKINLDDIKLRQNGHLTKHSEKYILETIESLDEESDGEKTEESVKFKKLMAPIFGFKGAEYSDQFELSPEDAKSKKIQRAISIGLITKM